MSDNQVTEFDSKSFNEKVSERIRSVMMDMLPEEQFRLLVEKEMKAFFEEPAEKLDLKLQHHNGYGNRPDRLEIIANNMVSPFRLLVWNMLASSLQPMLEQYKTDPDHIGQISQIWNENTQTMEATGQLPKTLEEQFKLMMPQLVEQMFSNMAIQAASIVQNSLDQTIVEKIRMVRDNPHMY